MSGEGTDRTEYVPREVLERLAEDLTVADVTRGREEYPDGDPMRGFAAIYHAAQRTGYLNGESVDQFLSRVRVRDLVIATNAAEITLPEGLGGGGTSLPSAATGE